MADSWDSIFKKQINIPEKESERKQSTLDSRTNSSKKQTLDEPINLSFLFDAPVQDFPSDSDDSDTSESNERDNLQRSQRSFGDEYRLNSHSNGNDDIPSTNHSKLPKIQWNQAKNLSNTNGKKYPRNSDDHNIHPKNDSFGGNRALNNMYQRIQSRDQVRKIENHFSDQSADSLGFQKLAARQNITADRMSEDPTQFANSRDQKLGIPILPNKNSSPFSSLSINSNSSPYFNARSPTEPKSPELTPVRGLKSFQLEFPNQPSNPSANPKNFSEDRNWGGYSSPMETNPREQNYISPPSSVPIYSAQKEPYSQQRNNVSYGSLHEAQQNLQTLRREYPNGGSPYSGDSYARSSLNSSRMSPDGGDFQPNFGSQYSYFHQSSQQPHLVQGNSNSGDVTRSFPHSPPLSNNYAGYGFQNPNSNFSSDSHPGMNPASPYSNSPYAKPTHPSQYSQQNFSPKYGFRQENFNQYSSPTQFYPPNAESRLTPVHLSDQITPLNQIAMRQEESRIIRQVQENRLSYPEPETNHLSANKDLRESLIIESLLDLPKSEPVKHEILQLLLASGPISETMLLRKIKKTGRYMGPVALGVILFHLIEEFGSDMIQRTFSDRMHSYSVTDRFKEIVATAMKNL